MTRHAVVAGQFYPSGFHELDVELKRCFEEGPGAEPGKRKGSILGVIAPHAGYTFSGSCAAWAYKAVGEADFPDAYLLIGLNHSGGETAFSAEDWATPIGTVKNHRVLTDALSEATHIPINEDTHRHEHSIEVQLPFLQFASRDRLAELRIIPLMIGREMDFSGIASRIIDTIEALGKKVIIITSSDFTHYGPAYGYIPFVAKRKESMYELDKKAIRLITDMDAKGFLKYIEDTGATICGKFPIALTIELLKGKAEKRLLEMYYTSGDIIGDYSNAVGYASIVFK